MKPNDIRRGIQSRHARSAGDGPNMGRVSRVRDADAPAVMRWGGRRGGNAELSPAMILARRKAVLMWSLILTVVTLLVVGGLMMSWLRGHDRRAAVAGGGSMLENVRIPSKFVSPSEDEALGLVKLALANRDPGKVEAFFHLGAAKPEEVVAFISGMDSRDGRIERYEWLRSMDVDGLLMDGVLVVYTGKEGPCERLAFLVPDDHGVWKVDFEAFARLSRPSWQELIDGRADHAQVRVFVAADSYYNRAFIDDSRWVCYGIASLEAKGLFPEGQELLFGYCKVGSPQAKAMERIFENGSRLKRATLDIRRMEGADLRQFEIARVLAEDWVLTPKPLDERFN